MAIKFDDLPETVDQILTKVRDIEQLLVKQNPPAQDGEIELLNIRDAGNLLSLSVNTIYKLAQGKKIPYCKKGKRLYFFRDELLTWLREGKRNTDEELRWEAETKMVKANRLCK
jgi:excisionase family DNA binding protein